MTLPTLTIDLTAIRSNWRALDKLSGAAETGAAVKADAYGLGFAPVARALYAEGCRSFFVATLSEGLALRDILPDATIHILNGTDTNGAADTRAASLRPCLNSPAQVAAWRKAGGGPCALQLDSGMSRLGVQPADIPALIVGEAATLAQVTLIMSHLACADEPEHPQNEDQRSHFAAHLATLRPHAPNARASLAATGGTLLGPAYHHDLVRCGIGLYGGLPFWEAEPVVTLTTPAIQIRDVPIGTTVGYGADWTANRPSRIATLPLGYADGVHRAISNNSTVYINGKAAPVAGRVSMDLITIDVTDFPNFGENDPVEIIGPTRSIDALAADASTIGYELLTALGTRYERRYKGA